jgi:hypothetical protein
MEDEEKRPNSNLNFKTRSASKDIKPSEIDKKINSEAYASP